MVGKDCPSSEPMLYSVYCPSSEPMLETACCWAIWLRYHAASLSSDSKQVKDAPLDSKEIVLVKLKPKMAGDTGRVASWSSEFVPIKDTK